LLPVAAVVVVDLVESHKIQLSLQPIHLPLVLTVLMVEHAETLMVVELVAAVVVGTAALLVY
jgi:hypothetical protein